MFTKQLAFKKKYKTCKETQVLKFIKTKQQQTKKKTKQKTVPPIPCANVGQDYACVFPQGVERLSDQGERERDKSTTLPSAASDCPLLRTTSLRTWRLCPMAQGAGGFVEFEGEVPIRVGVQWKNALALVPALQFRMRSVCADHYPWTQGSWFQIGTMCTSRYP